MTTKNADKSAARERMKLTGEPYATALAAVRKHPGVGIGGRMETGPLPVLREGQRLVSTTPAWDGIGPKPETIIAALRTASPEDIAAFQARVDELSKSGVALTLPKGTAVKVVGCVE